MYSFDDQWHIDMSVHRHVPCQISVRSSVRQCTVTYAVGEQICSYNQGLPAYTLERRNGVTTMCSAEIVDYSARKL